MNPGDRVRLVAIRPAYLEGCLATVVREQPGEDRVLVRLDNDPKARKYAGGEWCVQSFTVRPDDTEHPVFELIRDKIDPACRDAAKRWLEDIARAVNDSANEWAAGNPGIDHDQWPDIVKPALLWRFYWHLSNELRMIAEGHEQVMRDGLREER